MLNCRAQCSRQTATTLTKLKRSIIDTLKEAREIRCVSNQLGESSHTRLGGRLLVLSYSALCQTGEQRSDKHAQALCRILTTYTARLTVLSRKKYQSTLLRTLLSYFQAARPWLHVASVHMWHMRIFATANVSISWRLVTHRLKDEALKVWL